MKVSLNGSIVNEKDARILAESDGLYYGAGCFETFTSYQGMFLHLNRHIRRLNDGISYLTGTGDDMFTEELIRSDVAGLLEANGLNDIRSRIRIQVSIAERLGYAQPGENKTKTVLIIMVNPVEKPTGPLRLATVDTTVVPASCRPVHLKLSNMLHYRQAGIEAKHAGADDALMLTVNGTVAETSIANIFWEKDGKFYTPSVSCDILPGVTRSVVIELISREMGTIKKGEFTPDELKSASQLWISNSVKEVCWVSGVDEIEYPTKTPVRNKLLKLFETYKNDNLT